MFSCGEVVTVLDMQGRRHEVGGGGVVWSAAPPTRRPVETSRGRGMEIDLVSISSLGYDNLELDRGNNNAMSVHHCKHNFSPLERSRYRTPVLRI